eukprot:5471511-Pleurochrysis_carterae.AAC.1
MICAQLFVQLSAVQLPPGQLFPSRPPVPLTLPPRYRPHHAESQPPWHCLESYIPPHCAASHLPRRAPHAASHPSRRAPHAASQWPRRAPHAAIHTLPPRASRDTEGSFLCLK